MKKYIHESGSRILCLAAVLLIGILTAGCKTADAAKVAVPHSTPDARVMLMPGDAVDIKFFYTPELNEEQIIRPDGNITLQLIGDTAAAGLTPAKLKAELEKKYTGLIEKPSVTVIARELAHRNVYVAGSVVKPGLLPMPGHTTVLAAVMEAGGFDMRTADVESVVVVRHKNGKRETHILDLQGVLSGEEIRAPFYLHAQDIVYVPRTGIVRAAQWIDQYITQLIPKTGFSLFYDTGSGNSVLGVDTTSKY